MTSVARGEDDEGLICRDVHPGGVAVVGKENVVAGAKDRGDVAQCGGFAGAGRAKDVDDAALVPFEQCEDVIFEGERIVSRRRVDAGFDRCAPRVQTLRPWRWNILTALRHHQCIWY